MLRHVRGLGDEPPGCHGGIGMDLGNFIIEDPDGNPILVDQHV